MNELQIGAARQHLKTLFEEFAPHNLALAEKCFDYLPQEDEGNFLKYGGYASPFIGYLLRPVREALWPDPTGGVRILEDILTEVLGGTCDQSLSFEFDPLKRKSEFRWLVNKIGIYLGDSTGSAPTFDRAILIPALDRVANSVRSRDYDAVRARFSDRLELWAYLRQQELNSLVENSESDLSGPTWMQIVHPCG